MCGACRRQLAAWKMISRATLLHSDGSLFVRRLEFPVSAPTVCRNKTLHSAFMMHSPPHIVRRSIRPHNSIDFQLTNSSTLGRFAKQKGFLYEFILFSNLSVPGELCERPDGFTWVVNLPTHPQTFTCFNNRRLMGLWVDHEEITARWFTVKRFDISPAYCVNHAYFCVDFIRHQCFSIEMINIHFGQLLWHGTAFMKIDCPTS